MGRGLGSSHGASGLALPGLSTLLFSPSCIGLGRAVLAPARHLKNTLGRWQAWPAASVKVKRQEWEAQGSPPGLYDKCLQLARAARRSDHHPAPH